MTIAIPPPSVRAPLVDPVSGVATRPFYRYLDNLTGPTNNNSLTTVVNNLAADLAQLEAAALDAVSMFGFNITGDVGTEAQNDDAFARAVIWTKANNGALKYRRGIYRHFLPVPNITAKSGAWICAGNGSDFGDPPVEYGTLFRHAAITGDEMVIDGATNFILQGIHFEPVFYKTSGAAVKIKNRSNKCSLIDLFANNGYRAFHIENSIYTTLMRPYSYNASGNAHIYISGDPAGSASNEGTSIIGGSTYTTQSGGDSTEEAEGGYAAWVAGMGVLLGDFTTANGDVWKASKAGAASGAGTGPARGAYVTSRDPKSIEITDGTAKWLWFCKADNAAVRIESGGDYVTMIDFKPTRSAHALVTDHTLGVLLAPKITRMISCDADHTYGDAVKLIKGVDVRIESSTLDSSVTGRALNVGAGHQGFVAVHKNSLSYSALDGAVFAAGPVECEAIGNIVQGNGRFPASTAVGIDWQGSRYTSIGNTFPTSLFGSIGYGEQNASGSDNFISVGNRGGGATTADFRIRSGTGPTKQFAGNVGAALGLTPCRFNAYVGTSTSNDKTGDGTAYVVASYTEIEDPRANFDASTGIFTADVTGTHVFDVAVTLANLGALHSTLLIELVASNRTFILLKTNPFAVVPGAGNPTFNAAVSVDMDAADTAKVQVTVSGSTKTVGIAGGAAPITYFAGRLLEAT